MSFSTCLDVHKIDSKSGAIQHQASDQNYLVRQGRQYKTVVLHLPFYILQGFHYSGSTLDTVFSYHSSIDCSNCPPIREQCSHYFGLNYVSF